jgi:hypothetical protein
MLHRGWVSNVKSWFVEIVVPFDRPDTHPAARLYRLAQHDKLFANALTGPLSSLLLSPVASASGSVGSGRGWFARVLSMGTRSPLELKVIGGGMKKPGGGDRDCIAAIGSCSYFPCDLSDAQTNCHASMASSKRRREAPRYFEFGIQASTCRLAADLTIR